MSRTSLNERAPDAPLTNQLNRRLVLRTAAAATAAALLPAGARARAAWPNRPIKIVDVFAPGGSTDAMARLLAKKMSPRLGQPVVVENRNGAGGALGIDFVAKAPPDGYTLLQTVTSNAVLQATATVGRKLPFDFLKDLTPIGEIAAAPLVVVVPANSPIKTLRDLVDIARAKADGGIRYGSSGVGSISHIGMELLASVANVRLTHIPYRGNSLAETDLLGGHLQAMLGSVATNIGLLESGKLRAIVVTSPKRSPFLPNVPTSAEAGLPDFQIEVSWGLMGPAGLPPDVVKRLNSEIGLYLTQPELRDFLSKVAATPRPGTPEDMVRVNAFEVARWSKLLKDRHIKIE
ncbi:Bug family tripartite tricarboxylate transporter substrate binding protein [Cupriavidus alkaliphilus]|uniref:Bug family tripartite tricarboxylate transporter substrate binding protein n=1 Tax=Cupriavidus alkaliphilus TaxID=942866 RepID=UPI001607BA2C|nr:tripartite tricarboxylate transporter substrate binding protein [Cupriavidus alkaliphilus]MBB3014069.1 tripartite-type tricarboxylate transporter receptor subunit TctC [Cupriavidus alkaliphilus]